MKRNAQTAREDESIQQAAERMALANVGFLPVCDKDGKPVGTITDRDIVVRSVAAGRAPGGARVGDVMTRGTIACLADDEITLAEQVMAQNQVSRLIITDDHGLLLGVISLSDIAEREPARRAARTLRAVAAREAPRPS